jgi:hypothetical protein
MQRPSCSRRCQQQQLGAHIAEAALLAALPAGWTVHLDARDNEFFFCSATRQSSYEHPMDAFYRQLYAQHKAADAVLLGAGCGPAAAQHQPQQH